MGNMANHSDSAVAEKEIVVVLLQPELLGSPPDLAGLRKTLESAAENTRGLLCLSDRTDDTIVDLLTKIGAEVQILLGPGIELQQPTSAVLHAPPGTSKDDQNEFALALSDVVLAAPGLEESSLGRMAAQLHKPIIAPGRPLPVISRGAKITARLDPDIPGWHSWPRVFGRFEQSIIELFAYNWLGRDGDGVAESRKRLRRCWSSTWRPASYFAPEESDDRRNWRKLAPDRSAVDDASKIVSSFDAMDRSALYGSYVHRDFVWIEYLGAALAVLMAVIGELWTNQHITGFFELLLLLLVLALVLFARHVRLQDRWMACRLGAEQLRIARMSLPLLVVPPALATADRPPPGDRQRGDEAEFGLAALAEVKRAVRAQGLPRVDDALPLDKAVDWLRLIVDDQIKYHKRNHRKLETAERRLRFVTAGIFVSAIIAVVTRFSWPAEGLILLTAAAPALAAALHGAVARLGIVHRSGLSIDAEKELKQISAALERSLALPVSEEAWRRVRRLAFEAAAAMGRENTSWHGLVRRYTDQLP
jgi:hypothetical protein